MRTFLMKRICWIKFRMVTDMPLPDVIGYSNVSGRVGEAFKDGLKLK